ncbi:MAG TPA: hypothetical protein DDW27_12530 [Bacteroidales bacterium]|nr:hypothetical protein [Bacteroidales bacterium]
MKAEDELIVKIDDPIKLLKEIEAFFTFTNPPSEKDVRLIRASINYCVDKIESQPKPAVEQPIQGESAEEILNSHPYLKTWTENPDDSAIEVCNIEQALWAMEEFASQRSELTDEEIEAQFPFDEDIDFVSNIDAQMGARWARDQIRDRQKGGKP